MEVAYAETVFQGKVSVTMVIYLGYLYICRFVIERTNAWLDAFKVILIIVKVSRHNQIYCVVFVNVIGQYSVVVKRYRVNKK